MVAGPVLLTLPRHQAGIVFLDPPYSLEREYAAALEALGEAPPALVVAQHSVRFALAEAYGPLARVRIVRQGDNALSFYAPRPNTVERASSLPCRRPCRHFSWPRPGDS